MRYILWVAMLEGACDVIQDGHHLGFDSKHVPLKSRSAYYKILHVTGTIVRDKYVLTLPEDSPSSTLVRE